MVGKLKKQLNIKKMTNNHVKIFDTTLRDGEQAPGCSMTLGEKLKISKALTALNVDIIEAGFPAASPGDFNSVKEIANQNLGPIICGLARCNENDINKVYEAVKGSDNHRIHVFVATSSIHREYKLKMAKEEIIKNAVSSISLAKSLCDDIEFSPEDASRTELSYLAEVVSAAIEAGATTVNIPDTVGYTVPDEFDRVFAYLNKHVKDIDKIILSVHCHDDLGMAVANSLSAVMAGARQIECTINGIGERAGNCSLEEVVMAINTREEHFNVSTKINTERLYPTSRMVASITGIQIPRNKAIVGENAFAHEAGIHQHGMLQHSSTYEIMKPEDIGLSKSNLILGKHSGRHAFRNRVEELGFNADEDQINNAFIEFKKLADTKKEIYDGDIEALIMNIDTSINGPWILKSLKISSVTGEPTKATVCLTDDEDNEITKSSEASGPVEAAFKTIESITDIDLTLKKFDLHSPTVGSDAQGEVTVNVDHEGQSYRGSGTSVDIVEAGSKAYLGVINRIIRRQKQGIESVPQNNNIHRAPI